MDKYDNMLSQILTKFYADSEVQENIRRIVKDVMNAEFSKLDKGTAYGIKHEIRRIIDKEAEVVSKHRKQ